MQFHLFIQFMKSCNIYSSSQIEFRYRICKITMLVLCLNNENILAYAQTHEQYIFEWEGKTVQTWFNLFLICGGPSANAPSPLFSYVGIIATVPLWLLFVWHCLIIRSCCLIIQPCSRGFAGHEGPNSVLCWGTNKTQI